MQLINHIIIGLIIFLLTSCTTEKKVSVPDVGFAPSIIKNQPYSVDKLKSSESNGLEAKRIALLLPLSGKYAAAGLAIRDGFLAAYYRAGNNDQPIQIIDTSQTQDITAAFHQATAQNSQFVIGPLLKSDVAILQNESGYQSPKIIALNYLSASLPHKNFYQFGLSPIDEAKQIAERVWQDGYRKALVITPAGAWGNNLRQELLKHWQTLGGILVDSMVTSDPKLLAPQLQRLLHVNPKAIRKKSTLTSHVRRQDFDVILMISPPEIARQIRPLLKFYYVHNVPIYATSLIYRGIPQPQLDRDLDDIIFCDMPWVLDNPDPQLAEQLQQAAGKQFFINRRFYALGIDSYQLIHELDRLTQVPSATMNGVSGLLYINNQSWIQRQLQWAKFHNGVPQPIKPFE